MIAVPKPTPRVREPKRLQSRPHVIPLPVRLAVKERQGHVCAWCKVPGGALDVHHRLRRSQGGKDDLRTLVAVHRRCHDAIHTTHLTEARSRGFLVRSEDELDRRWT